MLMHDPPTKTAYSLKQSPTPAPEDTAKFAAHGGPQSEAMKAQGGLWLPMEQAAPERLTPWKEPTPEQFVKNWENSCWRSLWRAVSCGRRERVWGAKSSWDKHVKNWLQPPFLVTLCHSGRKIRSEVEPVKKGRVGWRCFKNWVYFSLSYSDLICNELMSLNQVYFAHDHNSVSPYLNLWVFCYCFSALSINDTVTE